MPKLKKTKGKTEAEVQQEEVTITTEKVTEGDIHLTVETCVGDIRDNLLDRIRNMKRPWESCSELEQQAIIDHMTAVARTCVEATARMIASKGRTTIVSNVETVNIKNNVKVTLTTRKTPESINALGCIQGMECLLIPTGEREFLGEGDIPHPDPEQADIENYGKLN